MMKVVPPPPIRLMPLTPGASSASDVKLRLAIGRFSTDAVATVKERSPLCAWMTGASPVTFTVSLAPPTSSVSVPIATLSPTLTGTPVRFRVLNPVSVTSTV